MKPLTTKEDLQLASRTLSFAVEPEMAGGILCGLTDRSVSRRSVDSSMLLTEVDGKTKDGLTVNASVLTFRDYPAVRVDAVLYNQTSMPCKPASVCLPDMEFCGSNPCILQNGAASEIHEENMIETTADCLIRTEEKTLSVRTTGKIRIRRSPCGFLLQVSADCPALHPNDAYSLPPVFLMISAGGEEHMQALLSKWGVEHGTTYIPAD